MRAREYFPFSAGCFLRSALLVMGALLWLSVLAWVPVPASAQDRHGPEYFTVLAAQEIDGGPQDSEKSPNPDTPPKIKVSPNDRNAPVVRLPNGDPPTATELNARFRGVDRTGRSIDRTMRRLDATIRDLRRDLGRIQRLNRISR